MDTTEALIQAAVHKFAAPRPTKFVSVPGVKPRHGHVHQDGEMTLFLPNGQTVKVHTDASGKATHVTEDDAMHAIVRPDTYKGKLFR